MRMEIWGSKNIVRPFLAQQRLQSAERSCYNQQISPLPACLTRLIHLATWESMPLPGYDRSDLVSAVEYRKLIVIIRPMYICLRWLLAGERACNNTRLIQVFWLMYAGLTLRFGLSVRLMPHGRFFLSSRQRQISTQSGIRIALKLFLTQKSKMLSRHWKERPWQHLLEVSKPVQFTPAQCTRVQSTRANLWLQAADRLAFPKALATRLQDPRVPHHVWFLGYKNGVSIARMLHRQNSCFWVATPLQNFYAGKKFASLELLMAWICCNILLMEKYHLPMA